MSIFRYHWGDTVRVAPTAPFEARPGLLASVCGMRAVTAENETSDGTDMKGTVEQLLYLVEFGDGYSIEVAEQFLEEVGDPSVE